MTGAQPERVFTLREVVRLLRLTAKRAAQLRRLGLLPADLQGARFRDLVACRIAASLLQEGATVRHVREALEAARRLAPAAAAPLAELRLVVEGGRVIMEQDRMRFEPRTGQGLLAFAQAELAREASESLAWGMVRPLVPPAQNAEAWFARASAWDGDPEQWEAAVEAYERVLSIDPGYAAAWNNLGLLQHRMGHYDRAGQCYRGALAADEACPQAAFNLGSLHEDLGDFAVAITWYRRAIEMAPDYADAHFNLAGVLGKVARPEEAARHWRRYLELDLGSPWAQIARSHLAEVEGRPDGGAHSGDADE